MINLIKITRTALVVLGLSLINRVSLVHAIPADQPKTNYDVNIYSQMITGWIADQNLEIIPEGQLGIPNTMIVLNEGELNGVACDTSDPSSCEKIAHVQYPQQNYREDDIPISGQCQKTVSRLDPNYATSTKGKCKFDQSKDYSQEFVGTDTSRIDDLAIPGWQSYNHMYTANQCAGKTNSLMYGSHDMILPSNMQYQLKLNLIWKAFSTWANYQKANNPRKEMPVGGINWKEKVVVGGEEIELIDIYNYKLPDYMKPPCYKAIWETDPDPNYPPADKTTLAEFQEEVAKCEPTDMPPVPKFLEKSSWLSKSMYFYKIAKGNKEDWVKYFDCAPLYSSHTNAPALSIGSLVLALGAKDDLSGKYNIAIHDATLVDNYSARAATEGKIIETTFLNNAETGKSILRDLGKKLPLVAHYFEEARTDVPNMPTALVFGNGNTSATSDMANSNSTVTMYKPLTFHQFGSVLDYPNRLYNPDTNPAPRMPKPSEEKFEKQDAQAVYDTSSFGDFIKNAFSVPREIFLKVIPHVERRYMVGETWSQAGRFLEKQSVSMLMPSTELEKGYLTKNNNINVVVTKEGELDGISERLSNTIKLNNSAFLPCQSDYRSDFANTPRMIADGTAINSCGLTSKPKDTTTDTCSSTELPDLSGSDLSCSLCNSGLPKTLVDIFNKAASTYKVPASILFSAFVSEGGDYRWDWSEENVKAWSVCGGEVPNCDALASGTGARGPFGFLSTPLGDGKYEWSPDYSESSKAIDSGRKEFSPCNVIDATFAAAAKLAKESGGSGAYPAPMACWGHPFYSSAMGPANSCNWTEERVSTAIRQYTGYCTEASYSGPGGSSGAQTSDNNHWNRAFDYYGSYSCK